MHMYVCIKFQNSRVEINLRGDDQRFQITGIECTVHYNYNGGGQGQVSQSNVTYMLITSKIIKLVITNMI